MIQAGTFKARAVEAALGFASTGSEQIAVDFVLLEGDDQGKHICWYSTFGEKVFARAIESLRACGWQGDDLSDLTGIDANEVHLVIEVEDDLQGQPRARVRWVNSLGGGIALKEKMNPAAAQAFAQRMKGAILASKNPAPAPANKAAPARVPGQRLPQTRPGVASGLPGTRATGELVGATSETDDIPF